MPVPWVMPGKNAKSLVNGDPGDAQGLPGLLNKAGAHAELEGWPAGELVVLGRRGLAGEAPK